MAIGRETVDFGGGQDIGFERAGTAAIVTLRRPEQLNVLTHAMIRSLSKALHAWRHDRSVEAVIIKGEGRAFSAGGDLKVIYNNRHNPPVDFFADEYRLNAQIEAFPKPYVALIDGLVLGGGAGISFHGSHRVMTENAEFAMPEVGIGFFPDVGASHLLPDLADNFGLYLGLTGTRVKWGDALWCGLVTHPVKAENLNPLIEMIASGIDVEGAMRNFFTMPRRETDHAAWTKIDGWFGRASLGEIMKALEAEAASDETAARILSTMHSKSPTSLGVTFHALTAGQTMSMADCMKMEFRIVNRMLTEHDFYEGIRATVIDKDGTPRWSPPSIAQVHRTSVDRYFVEPAGGDLHL